MLNEKKIYDSWKRRFSYPATKYEAQAEKTFQSVKSVTNISQVELRRRLFRHHLVFWGDDALVPFHKEIVTKQILSESRSHKVLFVTNRSPKDFHTRKMLTRLRRSKISVQCVSGKTEQIENERIYNTVLANIDRYDRVVIWTGHLRLAAGSFQKKFQAWNPLFVYLQCNALHWKFPDARGWKSLDTNQIAWMESSPLTSIDYYRSLEEKEFVLISPVQLEKTFYLASKKIASAMRQKNYGSPKKIVHVFGPHYLKIINRVQQKSVRNFMLDRVKKGESAVMPREKTVLLSTLNPSHIAEEAAHYLRTVRRSSVQYGPTATIIEEALAFFASLLLFPTRNVPKPKKNMNAWERVHWIGYTLGVQLWKLWNRSEKSRPAIRKLWNLYPKNESEAKMMLVVMQGLK